MMRSVDPVLESEITLHGDRSFRFLQVFTGGEKLLERQRIKAEPDLDGVPVDRVY
jgi:hypothetical protein